MGRHDFYADDKLIFVTALTHKSPSFIEQMQVLLEEKKSAIDPFKHVLVSPIFMNQKSINKIYSISENGGHVFFDSGGYSIQTGKIDYGTLYKKLIFFYEQNRWASLYTLPDHPSKSSDSQEVRRQNQRETMDGSFSFYHEMPEELRDRALGVVHGTNFDDIDLYVEFYRKLNVRHLGFGGFSTAGKNNEINVFDIRSATMVKYLVDRAKKLNMTVHTFGISALPVFPILKKIKVNSTDGSSWVKAAAFSDISLPFTRRYSVSKRSNISTFSPIVNHDSFLRLKEITGHSCGFCSLFESLQDNIIYRAIHNLIVIHESIGILNNNEMKIIKNILIESKSYYKKLHDGFWDNQYVQDSLLGDSNV